MKDLVERVAIEIDHSPFDRLGKYELSSDENRRRTARNKAKAAIAAALDDLEARSFAEEDLCRSFVRGFVMRTRKELDL